MNGSKIILDTNIVSYLMKGAREAGLYRRHTEGRLLAVAFITVGEMYFGAEKNNWGEKRRKELETVLRNYVVIPYDHQIARCYGRVLVGREKQGKPVEPNDAWIAACAVRHNVPLVTHNAKHFKNIQGLQVITEPPQ